MQTRAVQTLSSGFGDSGPLVDVRVGVSHSRRRYMESHGIDVPHPISLTFIVDTGAGTTMVNDQYMRALRLDPHNIRHILTATSDEKPTECATYDIGLEIVCYDEGPLVFPAVEVLARPLFNHSVDGMIGRDILGKVIFTMHGPDRNFRIQLPR